MRIPSYDDLSPEQDEAINLELDGNYLVSGPPGTGKTVIALYRAKLLSDLKKPVRLLMFSNLLSQYTKAFIRQYKLESVVSTYHAWVSEFYQENYRRRPPEVERWRHDWPQIMDNVATNPPPADSLAYLIVDEGQDLPRDFYPVAGHIARNLTVFADENQCLFEHNCSLHDIAVGVGKSGPDAVLARNYRNTREIAALAATFHTGMSTGIAKLPTRRGELPIVKGFTSLAKTIDFISAYERNNSDLDIGVLVPWNRMRERFVHRFQGKTKNPVQTYDSKAEGADRLLDFDKRGIKVITYHSSKGLEFDTVFLPEFQCHDRDLTNPELRMQLYVMLSRARDSLYITYSGEAPRSLSLFDAKLVERQ